MSNWEQIIATKARHGTFVGNRSTDEDLYYEFFAGSDARRLDFQGMVSAIYHRSLDLLKRAKVTFPKPALSLFQKRA